MISISVPTGIRKVADRFKNVFSGESCNYNSFCTLLCLHLFGFESLSEAVRNMGWSQSVSSLHKEVGKFKSNRFMVRLRASVLRKLKKELNTEDFCYAIDDTANPKFGKKIFGVGSWGKHGGGLYRGQRILVLALVNKKKGYALPIHYFFCKKQGEEGYQSGHELVVRILEEIFNEGFPRIPVVLDSWFDSSELMENLDTMKVTFCIHAKEIRKVRCNPSPKVPYRSWNEIYKKKMKTGVKLAKSSHQKRRPKTKYIKEQVVYIKKRKSPLKSVSVYNHLHDRKHFAVYITNDLKMDGYFLYELSRKRWLIEELFRNLKQNLSFGKLPCTGKEGAEISVCLPFALIISLQLFPDEWSQSEVPVMTMGTRVKTIIAENFHKSLHVILNNPNHKCVKKILSRRHLSRINKKPVDSFADARMVC
jgi:Transposase DDE domain